MRNCIKKSIKESEKISRVIKKVIPFLLLFSCINLFGAKGGFAPEPVYGSADNGAPGYVYRSPQYKTGNITGPIPSSDWWTNLLVDDNTQTISSYPLIYANAVSEYPAEDGGFGIAVDYKGPGTVSDWKISTTVVSSFLIWNEQMEQSSTKTRLNDYGDWHIELETADQGNHKMYTTITAGSPFGYYRFENGNPKIRMNSFGGFVDFYDGNGNVILAGVNDSYTGDYICVKLKNPQSQRETWWGIYSEAGTVWNRDRHFLTLNIGNGKDFMSLAALPSQYHLNWYRQHAYTKITDTRADFEYDEARAKITTTFNFSTTQLRSGSDFSPDVLTTLFAHQYKHLGGEYAVHWDSYYETLRGNMIVFTGNQFSTSLVNHGVLTNFNEPTASAGYNHDEAVQWINNEDYVAANFNVDTYATGKALLRNAMTINLADKLNQTDLKNRCIQGLYEKFADFFTYSPGQEEKWGDDEINFFTYFSPEGGYFGHLVGWRSGFGTTALNDGHFHYGYWIYAASILAQHHPTFIEDYGWAVEELIRHIASPYRDDNKYPYLRYFNPYTGRSYASGWYWDDNYQGNDQESTSECMNAWQSIYQWGQVTGNDYFKKYGLYLYWTEKSAIDEYWLDVDDEILHPDYNYTHACLLRENATEYNTHWGGAEQEWMYGIQLLPLTPGTLYMGLNQDYLNRWWQALGYNFDEWHAVMLNFISLFNPSEAVSRFQFGQTAEGKTTVQDHQTWSLTYNFIHNLNQLGTPSKDFYADKPSYGVFKKGDGSYTYVGYNPSANSDLTINFYNWNNEIVHTLHNIAPGHTVYSDAYKNNAGGGQIGRFGSAHSIPGTIEAENYDYEAVNGNGDTAFYDSGRGNTGGEYRSDGVDIETCNDSSGTYNVGWIDSGEWIEYTVNVEEAGEYTCEIRYASMNNDGKIRIEMNGTTVSDSVSLGSTDGWQTWRSQEITLTLSAGTQVMRLCFDNGGFNLNYLDFKKSDIPVSTTIALKSLSNNKYVCADDSGNAPLTANRDSAGGAWELFTLIYNDDDTISLQSHANWRYVCADNWGNDPLIANKDAIGGWEKFYIHTHEDGSISLLSVANWRWVCADNWGNDPLAANRDGCDGDWEKFIIEYK